MARINTVVPQELTHLFARDMVQREFGKILLVSSVAGYQATPTYAIYAAAKTNLLLFGEAMNFELRGSGVTASVVSPGMTRTEFLDVSGQKATFAQRMVMMESADVVRVGLKAMMKGKANVLPGFMNKVMILTTRLVPRNWPKWVAYAMMKNEDVSR